MSALVPELVHMASDPLVSTSDLLRRSLVVARRLAVSELADWINSELTGYKAGGIPDYRILRAQLVAENPYRGSIPFFAPPEMAEKLTVAPLGQSIPELLHLKESKAGIFSYFPPDLERSLMDMVQETSGVAMRPALKFSKVQIEGVIETVRSRILNWALDLEERGIIGEGMSFTPQEKQAVLQHYHISNVSGSQILISSDGATQTQTNTTSGTEIEALRGLIDALADALSRSTAQNSVVDELQAELATLRAQAASPKPKWDVIKATACSIKAVAEGAAGNILGELAKPHVQTLLSLAGTGFGIR